jgi:hypothetical protein
VWEEANVWNYVAETSNLVYTYRRKSDERCIASE